ncbi:MAG: putative formate C-acetyltransferase, partial [Clostridia bacterium]|nr:putative formate C-acetyltransferase [Clostridia bacterium]
MTTTEILTKKERIENLRKHALNTRPSMGGIEYEYLEAKGWGEGKYATSSHIARRGYAKKYLLSNALPVIDDNELIVGKYSCRQLTAEEQAEFELLRNYSSAARERYDGQASHMAVDYERLLKKGIKGVLTDIQEYISALDISIPENIAKKEFYIGCRLALEGLKAYAENYSKYAYNLAKNVTDIKRKNELEEIAAILEKVPYNPAKTFREALQSVHFLTFSMVGLYQWGRPDRYLIDYYKNDFENGLITPAEAQELIDCACILYNEYIPGSLAVGLMVGGRDEKGKDITNELTYMFLESIRHVRMIYPGVGLCVNKDTPKELLKLACEILAEGHSHPALFNDEVITKGLCYYGLSPEEACKYIHST